VKRAWLESYTEIVSVGTGLDRGGHGRKPVLPEHNIWKNI